VPVRIAINIVGQVAGFSNAADTQWHGFIWTPSGGMQKLSNLPGADSASANGIDDVGEVVGGTGNYAVLWHNDKSHTVENLGALGGWSTAFAIKCGPGGGLVWIRRLCVESRKTCKR
jgi:probable HAF family extracellular repeat protein